MLRLPVSSPDAHRVLRAWASELRQAPFVWASSFLWKTWPLSASDIRPAGGGSVSGIDIQVAEYMKVFDCIWIHLAFRFTVTGNVVALVLPLPFLLKHRADRDSFSVALIDNARIAGNAFGNGSQAVAIRRYDGGAFSTTADRLCVLNGFYRGLDR